MSAPSTSHTDRTWLACSSNPPLTHSEERVAHLVAHGYTNREIATRLFLSHHTVDSHIRHIYQKLQIRSRVALTRLILGLEPANT